jgi:hypothetical protein
MPLQAEWVAWWAEILRVLKDQGVMGMPLRGVAYRVDQNAKTLTAVVEHPNFDRKGLTAVLNERCVARLGYRVVYLDNPARTPETLIDMTKDGTVIIDDSVKAEMMAMLRPKPAAASKWPSRRSEV